MWIVFVLNFVALSVGAQFDNQYLGHHYTLDEYNNLELGCQTTICLRDAQRLLLAATQDNSTEPCENFPEFAMGRFIELAALHDRYETTGFENDMIMRGWERHRKVLAARIINKDIRPFKIAKNFYQNCLNSGKI